MADEPDSSGPRPAWCSIILDHPRLVSCRSGRRSSPPLDGPGRQCTYNGRPLSGAWLPHDVPRATPPRSRPGRPPRAARAASGLRGRGGGWFPAARKWKAVRVEGGRPARGRQRRRGRAGLVQGPLRDDCAGRHDVVRGAGPGRPGGRGARGDRLPEGLLRRPGRRARSAALAGASLDGLAVAIRRGRRQLHHRRGDGAARVARGPPALAAAEAAAARRGRASDGRPTLVQNVETLARVPAAPSPTPRASDARETTLVTLWGDVRRPGVYEVPLGTPLRRVIERPPAAAHRGDRPGLPRRPGRARRSARATSTRPSTPRRSAAKGTALGTGRDPRRRARRPARWRWRPRSRRSSSARTAASARPARSAPRASPASCAGSRRAARARATCATSPTWPASCPATATAPTAATAAAVATGMAQPARATRSRPTCEAAAARGPSRRHPDPFAPGSPERDRGRAPRSRSSSTSSP